MCFGLFGVQIVWGLQNVNTSRIFQTLGADVDQLPILWIAAPITGLLVQPIVGHLSDRTWGPLGRRRPYLFGGALLTALALLVMPNTTTLWSASVMLWVLTASVNIAMEPFRSFVADTLPEEQRDAGFAMQVFFIGVGAVFASALPWMLTHWFGISGQAPPGALPPSVRFAFYIGAVTLIVAVTWTVFTTSERPPASLMADMARRPTQVTTPMASGGAMAWRGAAWTLGGSVLGLVTAIEGYRREVFLLAAIAVMFGLTQVAAAWLRRHGRASQGLLQIVDDIILMPAVLRRLAIVQFFTWFGMFALWIYAIPAVAAHHFDTNDVSSAAYGQSADLVGILFAGYNGVAAIAALSLPRLERLIGRRKSHALCLTLGALGLAGFPLIDDPSLLWIPILGIGCAWASILSAPYAMVASAVPPDKMGVYMGIHNIFLVLPQLVASAILGLLVEQTFDGQAISALGLAAAALIIAAAIALTIPDTEGDRRIIA
ncbi:MAG: MFS transporter [Pseudomonadota bacterium]|uniref:MFS transporter n=1 Tax=Sphingomonas sp. ERG5 TaxID=1381597 RepID=UPI00054B64CB|nr:MFS transporter [Sphingomonas sp. ERG5]